MKVLKINSLPELLENNLENFVKEIARVYKSEDYLNNPDFLEKRIMPWHQFGLITHTKNVRKSFLEEVPELLRSYGVLDYVNKKLSEQLDYIEKRILFEASIPLHDLGKIVVVNEDKFDRNHEKVSALLLMQKPISSFLQKQQLSVLQIDYMKQCTLLHDVLGKEVRDSIKHAGHLSLDYLSANSIDNYFSNIVKHYADMKTEIGVFFLCDLLGKTDIRINAENDNDLRNQEPLIESQLKSRGLSPELKKAVMQLPINLKLAEKYFKYIC